MLYRLAAAAAKTSTTSMRITRRTLEPRIPSRRADKLNRIPTQIYAT